ncbi:MAG: large repetitive protein [Chthoniobacter sp.]|jgi:hypothetical protein|nr:large repetitive protein [Chthoniobacter sp.]
MFLRANFAKFTMGLALIAMLSEGFAQTPPIPRTASIVVATAGTWDFGYTFHTSANSLQAVRPSWGTAIDIETGQQYSGYIVIGNVMMGDYFWLTRDSDGATWPPIGQPQRMLRKDQAVDWSSHFPPIPNLQTLTFRIGGRDGDDFAVRYTDDTESELSPGINGYFTTWGINGQEVVYYYTEYTAVVDVDRTWNLIDINTGDELGSVTDSFEGWEPWQPNPPAGFLSLLLSSSRSGHLIQVIQDDNVVWNVSRAPGYLDPNAFISSWNTVFAGTEDERTYELRYFPAIAPHDPSQGIRLRDTVTGEEVSYEAGDGAIDLSLWYQTKQSLSVKIPASRRTHELWLHQPNGASSLVTPGDLQGLWSNDSLGRTWFSSYGYFDGTALYHPELDWWIYDVDAHEISNPNTPDLSSWAGANDSVDSDSDGLPDWYEFITGTEVQNWDSDGDGISDEWEVAHGLSPRDPSDGVAANAQHGNITNLRAFQRDQVVTYTFELPLSRMSHGFTFHYYDEELGNEFPIAARDTALRPEGSVDSSGFHRGYDSHMEVSFTVAPQRIYQFWLTDDTTGEVSEPDSLILRPLFSSNASPSAVSFAIPAERFQHSFVVVVDNTYTYPVTLGDILGEDVPNPNGSGTTFRSYGFFNAKALPCAGTFQLVDVTASEQAPENSTELLPAISEYGIELPTQIWSALNLPGLVRSVTINVGATNYIGGNQFTLHTSTGSLQGLYASNAGGNTYAVSASVGVHENFWLTRDSDGASSPQLAMSFEELAVDWSAWFPPVRNLQSFSFNISKRSGHSLEVRHPDGYPSPLTETGAGTLTSWDDNGQPVYYPYETYQADVDGNQASWTLFDVTTGEDLGQTTNLFEDWHPWHPNPPAGWLSVLLSKPRREHTIRLLQGDNTLWLARPAAGYESPDAFLSTWNTTDFGTFELKYFPATVPYDPNQAFWLTDTNTGEEHFFPPGTTSVDLSMWYSSPTFFTVKIAASRWMDQLWLQQPNGASFQLIPGNLQGSWVETGEGNSWFSDYGFFDASTNYHPDLDWWIYDARTGEASNVNAADLSSWMGDNSDSDSDGLPDWYEFIAGTDAGNWDTDGDGVSDGEEARLGRNPRNGLPVVSGTLHLEVFTPLE